ncbi:hypothetical protein [Flavonifractor plautii]|uniref:hypothetical protein n=1 Tax=Flavonifractor plautii TaxID=292800 RepID=UPI001D00D0EF|nr:hypothetical protein [Flavonifractor plautii]MCB5375323.1 hypothetical protein [Flavonifractor plautii]
MPGQKSRSFEVFSLTFTDFLSRQSKKSPPLIAFHRSPFILQPFSGCFFLAPIILHVPIKVQVFLFPVLYLKHKEGQRTRKKQSPSKQNQNEKGDYHHEKEHHHHS